MYHSKDINIKKSKLLMIVLLRELDPAQSFKRIKQPEGLFLQHVQDQNTPCVGCFNCRQSLLAFAKMLSNEQS